MDVFSISTDSFSIRIFSRIFSLISLTSIVLITRHFLLSRLKINKKFTYLILALILIFSFPWYSISRPDVLLMLLLTLAIIQINSIIDNPRIRNILLLSFIFALSIFVKQTALFYTIFFLIGLLVIKEFKSSGMLLLLTGVFCIIIYFLIDLLGYDLQFYRLNVLKGVDNGLSLSRALEMSYSVYFSYYLTFTSLLIISCSMVFQKLKNDKLGLFLISINILFFISSTIFALKVGSTINYYNESLIFQLILSALIFEHLSISQKSFSKIFLLITVIQISLIHIVAYRARILRAVIIQDYSKIEYKKEVNEFLNKNIDSSFFVTNDRSIALANLKHVAIFSNDIHQLCYLEKTFDYSEMQNSLKLGQIKFIIETEKIDQLFDVGIKDHYKVVKFIGPYTILQSTAPPLKL